MVEVDVEVVTAVASRVFSMKSARRFRVELRLFERITGFKSPVLFLNDRLELGGCTYTAAGQELVFSKAATCTAMRTDRSRGAHENIILLTIWSNRWTKRGRRWRFCATR